MKIKCDILIYYTNIIIIKLFQFPTNRWSHDGWSHTDDLDLSSSDYWGQKVKTDEFGLTCVTIILDIWSVTLQN